MKKVISLLLAILMMVGLLAGCGAQKEEPAAEATQPAAEKAEEPATPEIAPVEEKNKDLSILWSAGGNGEYVNYTVDYLEKNYGANVDIEYNSKAHEIFQPQLIAGNPPDIVMVQHSFFNYYEAIQAGAFQDVSPYLSLPVNNSDKTVYEVANPSIIDSTSVDGGAYLLMSNMNIKGLYYNKAMFDEHGWEVPETWDEFMALCETIKTTTDIAPFAYPGMLPYYLDCFLFPQICSLGNGAASFADYNNMKEGFWTSEPVQQALDRIQTMRDKGYFMDGLISLNHTETQMEFINGNVAIIAAGSWLENEMAGNWPDGFELAYMKTPSGATPGDEFFVQVSGNMFAFPAAAENKDWVGEFLQTYYSEESAATIAKDCGVVVSPAVVQNEEIRAALPSSVIDSFAAADSGTLLYSLASMWYSEFYTNYQNTLTALISGDIDAAEFCQTVEDYAAAIRADDSIAKYTVG